MSHPDPHHDPENVRTDDDIRAPKSSAHKALRSRATSKSVRRHTERTGKEPSAKSKYVKSFIKDHKKVRPDLYHK